MRTRTLVGLLLLGTPVAAVLRAQDQAPLAPARDDIRNVARDIGSVWSSPRRATRNDLAVTAVAAGLVGVTALRDSAIWAWMTSHPNTLVMRALGPIREGWKVPAYELGSGQFLLPLSAAAYVAGRASHSSALRDAGLGCAAGHLSTLGIRSTVFRAVARARPRVTPEPFHISIPGSKDWSWQSFLSGHIANSMACASFLEHRYSLGIAKPLPYLYSAAIGFGRMADGRHWASDTMTGAILGFAIGKAIANRQLARHSRASLSTNQQATPAIALHWSFTFD